jgi:hypothetical protein
MSLAYFAAPIDDNSTMTDNGGITNNNSDNVLNQKRHKKTQRKYPKIENFDTNKVNSVLQRIHNNTDDDDDEDTTNMKNFNPPPKPISMGAERTIPKQENFSDMKEAIIKTVGSSPIPNYENTDNLDLNNYNNYGDDKSNEEYYKKVMPGYNHQMNQYNLANSANRPIYNYHKNAYMNNISQNTSQDVLLQKLNYMISLLEDQQDEKTNNVTEEVILYSFLGIFMIFLADTFVKAGKYTR